MRWRLFVQAMVFFVSVSGQSANRNEVIITEFLSDPFPSVGLPETEFIELKNISHHPISVRNWIITDGKCLSRIAEDILLPPDIFLIVCPSAYKSQMDVFGRTTGVSSFPSLDNSGDQISLFSADGKLIHAIEYRSDWHEGSPKINGGWSQEITDVKKPCTGKINWDFSRDISGGTPGKPNSRSTTIADDKPPELLYSYAVDSIHVLCIFNKPLDSVKTADPLLFSLSNDIGNPKKVRLEIPVFNIAELELTNPLNKNSVYSLSYKEITDCYGNKAAENREVRTGLAGSGSEDLVLNEILFNPSGSGSDYIELYNNGENLIDLNRVFVGARKSNGLVDDAFPCSEKTFLVFPGDYIVITEDTGSVIQHYNVKTESRLLNLNEMPAMPDDEGTIVLMDINGDILEEFSYSAKFHYPLLANTEGVALERIDPSSKVQNPSNWFSASANEGYGTPGYVNSQHKVYQQSAESIYTDLKIFSPDFDGIEDQLTVYYHFSKSGTNCTIDIFNQSGFHVKNLVKNQLCGYDGYYRWNGLDDENHRLNTGIYFLVANLFDLDGKRKTVRKAIVLANR